MPVPRCFLNEFTVTFISLIPVTQNDTVKPRNDYTAFIVSIIHLTAQARCHVKLWNIKMLYIDEQSDSFGNDF